MILYHGTIREYEHSILQHGLIPNPDKAFHVARIPLPPEGAVYLTDSYEQAKLFAMTRAAYTTLNPGEQYCCVDGYLVNKRLDGQSADTKADTTPIVVKVDTPEGLPFGDDPDSLAPQDHRCICTISPEHIVAILPV